VTSSYPGGLTTDNSIVMNQTSSSTTKQPCVSCWPHRPEHYLSPAWSIKLCPLSGQSTSKNVTGGKAVTYASVSGAAQAAGHLE
jgi:hypothetical protein